MSEAVTAPVPGSPPPTAPEPAPNLHKVKVDGAEMEIPYDELIRDYQTRKASDKAFREGAQARKEAEQLVLMLKNDPISVLKDPRLGHDVRKLAEEYLAAQIGDELMDPKDRELRDLKKWKQDQDDAKANEAKTAKEKENAELTAHYTQEYSTAIVDVLQAGGLPKTPTCVKRMAYYMNEGLKRNLDLSPKDVVGLVRDDFIAEQRELYGNSDGDTLLSLLGEDVAAKIRKHDLSRLKQSGSITAASKAPRASREAPKEAKGISKDEWRERMKEYTRG